MMNLGLPRLTVRQLNRLLSAGLVTSEQVCSYCFNLAVAGEEIWKLHAFSDLLSREDVLDQARASDERRRKGETLSALDGIPISIKANLAVANRPLTAGSRILGAGRSDTPAIGYNADVVQSLLVDNGAILMGMTTMDEFGMGSLGTNVVANGQEEDCATASSSSSSSSSPAKNPRPLLHRIGQNFLNDQRVSEAMRTHMDEIIEAHVNAQTLSASDPEYCAGGSSCGSAASIAHGSSLISLGSDTGGSIRLPAAWCGVTGVKPSYGLLSRHGLVSYASSLDTVGILAPSVHCATAALERLVHHQSNNDSTRSTLPPPEININAGNEELEEGSLRLKGIRIGIPAAFSVAECPSSLRDTWARGAEYLERQGASIETIPTEKLSPDILQRALAAYYVLVSAEASSNLARYDGFRYGVAADAGGVLSQDSPEQGGSDMSLLERQYAATRVQGLGKEVIRRVLCGTSVLSSDRFHTYYEAAAKLRAVLTRQLHESLNDVDLLLVPTALFPPPQIGGEDMDATEMFANDVMTVPISLAGLPSVSVPVGLSVGTDDEAAFFQHALQLIGPRHGEATMLRTAAVLEGISRDSQS
jgi:aspartyl-tRNA(Asn)/glutamyl-tRNA(Gln) amidotransferase subunit A